MTDQEFRDQVIAFMARIDETLRNLPCRAQSDCAISSVKKTDWKKWIIGCLAVGVGGGLSLSAGWQAMIEIIKVISRGQ